MHSMKRIVFLNTLLVLLLSLTSCGGTKLTSAWKDTSYEGTIDKIMVVAVTENTRNRLIFERDFVEAFKKIGVEAFASVDIVPSEEKSNEGVFLTEARKRGYNYDTGYTFNRR